jgi:hypothetical protein
LLHDERDKERQLGQARAEQQEEDQELPVVDAFRGLCPEPTTTTTTNNNKPSEPLPCHGLPTRAASSHLDSVEAEKLQQHAGSEDEAVGEADVAHGAQTDGHALSAAPTVIRQEFKLCGNPRNAHSVLLVAVLVSCAFVGYFGCCFAPRKDTSVTWQVKLQHAAISEEQRAYNVGVLQ